MPKLRRRQFLLTLTAWLVATVGVVNGQGGLSEVTPTIAVADERLTERIRTSLSHTALGSWTPRPVQALAAGALVQSEHGQRDIIAKGLLIGWHMEPALKRIKKSRFQVFGLVIAGRKHLLVDATPLESDVPDLWLSDCISCNVFDGGAAYWSALIRLDVMRVTSAGRRP